MRWIIPNEAHLLISRHRLCSLPGRAVSPRTPRDPGWSRGGVGGCCPGCLFFTRGGNCGSISLRMLKKGGLGWRSALPCQRFALSSRANNCTNPLSVLSQEKCVFSSSSLPPAQQPHGGEMGIHHGVKMNWELPKSTWRSCEGEIPSRAQWEHQPPSLPPWESSSSLAQAQIEVTEI